MDIGQRSYPPKNSSHAGGEVLSVSSPNPVAPIYDYHIYLALWLAYCLYVTRLKGDPRRLAVTLAAKQSSCREELAAFVNMMIMPFRMMFEHACTVMSLSCRCLQGGAIRMLAQRKQRLSGIVVLSFRRWPKRIDELPFKRHLDSN